MDNSNFILIYWRKEQKVFHENFEILNNRPDKNAVHDIRVAIKKLRACLKLYSLIRKEKDGKDFFAETKKLFSILGKERDIETSLELITGYEEKSATNQPSLKEKIQVQLEDSRQRSQQGIRNYSKDELIHIEDILVQDDSFSEKEWVEKTIDCINTHIRRIKKYFKEPHQIRKILKDVYYWIKMLPEGYADTSSYEKPIGNMMDDFGNWQNDEVLIMLVKHFRQDYLPTAAQEYESIKILEKKIKGKKKKLLKSALRKIKKLLKEKPIELISPVPVSA